MPNISRRVMRDIRDRGRDLEHVLQQVKSLKQTKEILEANEKALDTTQHIQRITENLNCHSTFPVHYPGEAGLWRVLLADKKICGCDRSSGSWEHRRHRPDFAAHAGLARSRVSLQSPSTSRISSGEAAVPGKCLQANLPKADHQPLPPPSLDHQPLPSLDRIPASTRLPAAVQAQALTQESVAKDHPQIFFTFSTNLKGLDLFYRKVLLDIFLTFWGVNN